MIENATESPVTESANGPRTRLLNWLVGQLFGCAVGAAVAFAFAVLALVTPSSLVESNVSQLRLLLVIVGIGALVGGVVWSLADVCLAVAHFLQRDPPVQFRLVSLFGFIMACAVPLGLWNLGSPLLVVLAAGCFAGLGMAYKTRGI